MQIMYFPEDKNLSDSLQEWSLEKNFESLTL